MHHHPRSAMRTSVALLPAMRLHIVSKTSIIIDKLFVIHLVKHTTYS